MYDEFNDNFNDWPITGIENKSTLDISNGKYNFGHLRVDNSWYTNRVVSIDKTANFEIKTGIFKVSGVDNFGYGLIFGRNDNDNQYYFNITSNGYYRISIIKDGEWIDIVPWTKSAFVNQGNGGFNDLTVRKVDGKLKFYMNDNFVHEMNYTGFYGDRVGYIIYKNQKIAVDYLRISYLQNQYYSTNQIVNNKPDIIQQPEPNNVKLVKSDIDSNIPVSGIKNNNTFAVVIGNQDYEHEIKVEYALNDARTFKEYAIKTLGVPSEQVHLIENATIGDFIHELDWLNKIAKAYSGEAKILFFYAGHGMPDQSTKDAFILPVDGYASNARTAIKLQEIYDQLNEYPTKAVTVFLDACFSGASRDGMLAEGRGVTIKPKEQVAKSNMVIFTAVSGDETAHPYKDKKHGLFTYFLLKKLQDTKGDVNLDELQKYVSSSVLRKSVIQSKEQNPTLNTSPSLGDSWKTWKFK